MRLVLPASLLAAAGRGPTWAAWVDRLPSLTATLLEEWHLLRDGDARSGETALVVPVRTDVGEPAMLKLAGPDEEARLEHLALQRWGGHGAVRLLRADPARGALLLERLHARSLDQTWDVEACQVVASLYQHLHVPALPQLRPQTAYLGRWTDELARLPRTAPLPRRLVEQTLSLTRGFLADEGSTGTMIHGDLHYQSVLAGDRAPWLAIAPKPTSGDPHYEVAPLLWNRWEELAGDVRRGIRRRFLATVDAAGLDEGRARDWVIVRVVHNATWELTARPRPRAGFLTMCVSIAKAVQD